MPQMIRDRRRLRRGRGRIEVAHDSSGAPVILPPVSRRKRNLVFAAAFVIFLAVVVTVVAIDLTHPPGNENPSRQYTIAPVTK